MVVKLSQVKFLLHVHDFDSSSFISRSEHITVFSYAKSRYVFGELVDLSDGLLLDPVNNFEVPALTDENNVFLIVI